MLEGHKLICIPGRQSPRLPANTRGVVTSAEKKGRGFSEHDAGQEEHRFPELRSVPTGSIRRGGKPVTHR